MPIVTRRLRAFLLTAWLTTIPTASADATARSDLGAEIDRLAAATERQLIEWRRHIHQHPELSNREAQTAKFVAEKLRSFGLEPQTGVARHGVVAVLKGGRPGPVVALRADMDALPIREETDLPFASKATGEYEGQKVPVMHACGHDAHTAILLATARVLSQLRDQLPGTVKFIFQPAEEGAVPAAERPSGAAAMVKAGVMDRPKVDAIFALHVFANVPTGQVNLRRGPYLAASDVFEIVVKGKQTHGAAPWRGVDPIVIGSEIVMALQTIVSRTVDITAAPAVVSVGQFQAGVRNNIIPDSARLVGTIRTFDETVRAQIHERVRKIAQGVAQASGATAEVKIEGSSLVTINNPALATRMLPTLQRVAPAVDSDAKFITVAEDFSYLEREAPGLYFFLGVTPKEQVGKAAHNHSPGFMVDEKALPIGVRALAHLAVEYLSGGK